MSEHVKVRSVWELITAALDRSDDPDPHGVARELIARVPECSCDRSRYLEEVFPTVVAKHESLLRISVPNRRNRYRVGMAWKFENQLGDKDYPNLKQQRRNLAQANEAEADRFERLESESRGETATDLQTRLAMNRPPSTVLRLGELESQLRSMARERAKTLRLKVSVDLMTPFGRFGELTVENLVALEKLGAEWLAVAASGLEELKSSGKRTVDEARTHG